MADLFLLRLADRLAALKAERDETPEKQRAHINGLIGLAQAIEHDYLTARTDTARVRRRVARFAVSSKSEIVVRQGEEEARETAKRLTRQDIQAAAEERDGVWFVRKVEKEKS